MKKVVLIALYNVLLCSFLLKCMEERGVQVGAFAYAGQDEKQNARYDIKRLGDSVGIGLFDGYHGKDVALLLKDDFFHYTVYSLIKDGCDVEKSLHTGLECCEREATDDTERDEPMAKQASLLIASWIDLASREGHVLHLGDSIACLIGNKPISMASPQKVSQFVGAKIFKSRHSCARDLMPNYYSYKIEDDYDYLVLATHGLYDVLANEDDEVRHKDFKKIFFDALNIPEEEFNQLYPLHHYIVMKSEEGSDSEWDDGDDSLPHGMQYVTQDDAMTVIAKKLVQVALSRGGDKNITVIVQSLKKEK